MRHGWWNAYSSYTFFFVTQSVYQCEMSPKLVTSLNEKRKKKGVVGVTIEKQPYPMGQGRAKLHFCPVNKTLQLITSAKSIPCEIEGNNRQWT